MRKKLILSIFIFLIQVFAFTYNSVYAQTVEISDEAHQKAEYSYKKGIEMVRIKAYDQAITAFQNALQYNPNLTDALYNIASIYCAQKKYDEAYKTYVKIIEINPYDYDSILQVAKLAYNKQNYSLAMKYLKYIPDDYENYYMVQQLYSDAKEQFETQKNRVERSKLTTANKNERVLIDKFNSPAGMAVDSNGNMYVAAYSDNAIIKVDKNKNKTNYVKDYLLNGPVGLAIDMYDNLYVANYDGNNILKITRSGHVSVFMDKVSKPYFLYIKDDILYISEQGNDVVLTYNLSNHK